MAKKSAHSQVPARRATATSARTTAPPRTTKPAGGSGSGAAALRAAFSQATRTMQKAWNDSRTVQDTGGTYEQPTIPDGKYVCQITSARLDAPQVKKGPNKGSYQALLELRLIVREAGEEAGKQLRITHWLTETEWRTMQEALERLFKDLQRLGYSTQGMSPDDLFEVAKDIAEKKPYVSVTTKTKTGDDGTDYLNVYLNKLVDPADYDLA